MLPIFISVTIILCLGLPVLYDLIFSPLRKVPGPFWSRLSGLWEFRILLKGHSNREFIRLHEKYGPVMRVAPNRYSFNQSQDVRIIYDLGGKFNKSDYYSVLQNDDRKKDGVFVITDNDYHKDRRRKISSLYTMSTMVSYEGSVDKMTAVCIRKLREFVNDNRLYDLPQFMQYYAFDVIGEITFNQSFSMMENEGDTTGMIGGIRKGLDYLAHIGLLPKLHHWIAGYSKLIGDDDPARRLVTYTITQIERYRKEGKTESQNATFLKKLFDLEVADKVNMTHIMDATSSNIAAGSDTTAITLSSALYYLYKNPEKLAKLRHEIDMMAVDGQISNPVTFQEAQNMPYFQAVIKESLRIHPAVGTILARVVPKGGTKLGGFYFPEGTHVGANPWALHYSKEIFGQDADLYRPERWLESKADHDDRNAMMFAFGGGSRTCLGKNISLLEINKVIPQIVRSFDIVFEDEAPMDTYCAWFVYPKFKVRTKLRESSIAHSNEAVTIPRVYA